MLLRDLLITTKDGDWGKGEPAEGHTPVHVIRGTDFYDARLGKVDDVPLRYLSEATLHRRILLADDILIETAGGSRDRPTGRTLLITQELLNIFPGLVTCASFARFLRINPSLANPRFVYWYLQDIYNSGAMWEHQVQHTGVARFQYTRFAETVKIPLPSRSTQDVIAAVLRALDDKIVVNERIAETANKLAGALFRNYHDLQLTQLSDVATVTMGQSPPGHTYNDSGIGLPFYQGTRDFGSRYPGKRIWCTAVMRTADEDDVLVSVRAPVGKINVAAEKCGIGRGVAAVRSSGFPHVMLHALSADPTIWAPYEADGTVFGSINQAQFARLQVYWPCGDNITDLEFRLSTLDNRLRIAVAESATLASLRDTLLPKLMSGQLSVKQAEALAEDVT